MRGKKKNIDPAPNYLKSHVMHLQLWIVFFS